MKLTIQSALLTLTFAAATLPSGAAEASHVGLEVALGKPVMIAGKKQNAYLKIGLEGLELDEPSKRTPINLAVVLDRSSSMSGDKIVKAREAALMVLERLGKDDILSIITYDSTVEVLVPATKVADREALARRIRALSPRGSTALFAGLSRGIEEARKFLDDGRVTRVILLSDGQANIGPSSPNELGRLGAAAGKEGIAVSTIGLGLGYNEDLMAAIAQKSDGNHAFAQTGADLAKLFDHELGDVLSVVAQEVSIKARVHEGFRPVRVLNREAEIHGRDVYLSLNQLYAKQEKYFLLELEVPASESGATRTMANVEVSWSDLGTKKTERTSKIASVRFDSSPAVVAKSENRDVMIAAVEAIAVEKNAIAVALRDEGKVQQAKKVLLDNASFLDSEATRYRSPKLRSFSSTNKDDAANLQGPSWSGRRKLMRKKQHELNTQQSY